VKFLAGDCANCGTKSKWRSPCMIKYPVTKTDGQVAELWSDKYPCCISSLNFGTGFDRQGATTPRQLADSVDLNSLVDILNDSRAAEIDREKVLEAIRIAVGRRGRERIRPAHQ
jgi:hypothetical protein